VTGAAFAPSDPQGRAGATRRRRQAILDAALECFSTLGYDETTLADIRERAGASTGSIYHHFGSKEHIAANLYLDGVRQTQEAGLRALLRTRTGRTGIAAQVGAYVDWVVEHPTMARFLFTTRHAPFLDDAENTIAGLEEKIRRALARGAVKGRDLKRRVSYQRFGLWVWNTAVANLVKAGEILHDRETDLYWLAEAVSTSVSTEKQGLNANGDKQI